MLIEIPKAFRPLLDVSARYKGYWSGRGCAKSWSFADAAVLKVATLGWRILCCREHQRSIKESVKAILDDKILRAGLHKDFHSTNLSITCRNGGGFLFEGLHANVQGIRSKEGVDAVWVEEANTVTQSSLDILIPTIRKPKSELWFCWNPNSPKDPVDKLFRGENAQSEFDQEIAASSGYDQWMVGIRVTHEDNKFFPDVLRAEMESDRRRDPDRYAHVWLGEYAKDSESRVFRNWKIGVVDPGDARPYYGADWGFIDPTVLVRCYVWEKERKLYIDAERYATHLDISKIPRFFDEIVDDPNDRLNPRKWVIKADSARPEVIQFLKSNGYPRIEPARKGPGSVAEGVEFLQSYDITVNPNCKRTIDEMSMYSYEIDPLTNEVLPDLADEDNNVIDALRYAVEAIRRGQGKVIAPVIGGGPRVYFGDNV